MTLHLHIFDGIIIVNIVKEILLNRLILIEN